MKPNKQRRLMTAREIKDEFICMDIRKLRNFLNANIPFVKIGSRYYYQRLEVEKLLTDTDKCYEYNVSI